jgi:DNA-binding protein YbaB
MSELYTPQDEERYQRMARDATRALDAVDGKLEQLAATPVAGRSRDGLVSVRVTGAGQVAEVRLRPGALHQYSVARLGEVVTLTLRATQQRAREEFERAARELTPPEVVECERLIRRSLP